MAAPEVAPISYPNNKPPNAGNKNLNLQEFNYTRKKKKDDQFIDANRLCRPSS